MTKLDFNSEKKLRKIPILITKDNEYGIAWRAEIADNYESYKPMKAEDINFEDLSFHFHHLIEEKNERAYLFYTKKDAIECARYVNKTYLSNKAKIYT